MDHLATFHAEQPLDGLILASPNNPTGTMVNREDMRQLAVWCADNGVRLVSDEISWHYTATSGYLGLGV